MTRALFIWFITAYPYYLRIVIINKGLIINRSVVLFKVKELYRLISNDKYNVYFVTEKDGNSSIGDDVLLWKFCNDNKYGKMKVMFSKCFTVTQW